MEAAEIVQNYSYTGDVVTIFVSFAIMAMISQILYFETDIRFTLLKIALHFVFFAAIINIGFAVVCKEYSSLVWAIYALKSAFHLCLIITCFIFLTYLRHMVKMKSNLVKLLRIITLVIFVGTTLTEILNPILHVSFYYEDGEWTNKMIFNPFVVVYIYTMILAFFMLAFYSDRLVRSVRNGLISIEVICCAIVIFERYCDSNAYTCSTFIIPIMAVLVMLHSKPYDIETGAMGEVAFDSYVSHMHSKKKKLNYIVVKLDVKTVKKIPSDMAKILSAYGYRKFKDFMFFDLHNGVYCLAVESTRNNGDIHEKTDYLFNKVIPKYYPKYNLKYRIIALYDIDFIADREDMDGILTYLFDSESENTYIVDEKKITELRQMHLIKSQLEDIDRRRDLNDDRIIAYAQPVMNVNTKRYDTAEALMRMSIDGEIISPLMIIPIAESYGYIHTLSMIMLNKVCRFIRASIDSGCEINRISVNFSVLEFQDDNFCNDVIEIINANGIPFEKIGIEITESQDDSEYDSIKCKVAILKEKGIKIYLDDYGTGYSNFDRIMSIGLDVVKFDRAFLLCANENSNTAFALKNFSAAFKALDYKILFEGIETDEQEKMCYACGADYLQGFMFSRPIPIDESRNFFKL